MGKALLGDSRLNIGGTLMMMMMKKKLKPLLRNYCTGISKTILAFLKIITF